MSENEALKRRDDELTMGDEAGHDFEGELAARIGTHDGLPRDKRGRVLGTWHIVVGPDTAAMDRVGEAWKALEGDLVDRAISLGCSVAPGAYDGPVIAPEG